MIVTLYRHKICHNGAMLGEELYPLTTNSRYKEGSICATFVINISARCEVTSPRHIPQLFLLQVEVPVLVLWGEKDSFLGADLAAPPPQHVPNARVKRFAEVRLHSLV